VIGAPSEANAPPLRRRIGWLSLAALALVPLAIAACLSPSPTGYGTHMALGLGACDYLLATGHRCPGCGVTTAFADMIRARPLDALHANALGVLLFLGDAALVPAALVAGARAMPAAEALRRVRRTHAIELLALSFAAWLAAWAAGWHH
jgi:hypothetical protein